MHTQIGGDDAGKFVNRKGVCSINGQVTCDAKKKITNIVAWWPGSTYDSRIFQEIVLSECTHTMVKTLGGGGGTRCVSICVCTHNLRKPGLCSRG